MYALEQWFAFTVVHQPASGSRCAAEPKRAGVEVATSLVQWGSHMDVSVLPLGQYSIYQAQGFPGLVTLKGL